jgi:Arc-like DNA binding domain
MDVSRTADEPQAPHERHNLLVRVPVEIRTWLRAQSRRNASSQNSEIVRAVRERMDREKALEFLGNR